MSHFPKKCCCCNNYYYGINQQTPKIIIIENFLIQLNFARDYLNGDKASSFPLTLPSEQHTYYTRSASSDHLVIELFRTNLRKFSPIMSGKYFWNNIPSCICQKPSKKQFKSALKSYYAAHAVLILHNFIYICSTVQGVIFIQYLFFCHNI